MQEEGGVILGSASTDRVTELNHTHWLSFTSRPQAFEILHTLANSVTEGKQEQASG